MNSITQQTTQPADPPAVADGSGAILVPAEDAPGFTFMGGQVHVRLSGQDTNGWLCVHDSQMPVGKATPLHVQPNDDESFVVLDGTIEFYLDGTRVLAHTGDALHVPRGVPHAFRVLSPDGARVLAIGTPARHEQFFALAGDPIGSPPAEGPPDMARMGKASEVAGFQLLGPPPFED